MCAGEPGERGEGGTQTSGEHDSPGHQPSAHQGGDRQPESGPRRYGSEKRYHSERCSTLLLSLLLLRVVLAVEFTVGYFAVAVQLWYYCVGISSTSSNRCHAYIVVVVVVVVVRSINRSSWVILMLDLEV